MEEATVSKKPAIDHDYKQRKDRFDIRLKHFDLGKKWARQLVLNAITRVLDKKSVRKKRGRKVNDPISETRIQEVGD